eukprot:XP_011682118.1 PREDICTED: uncharacterized protein LOC105446693 [Strongylocentrotus purpuratus]
MLSGRMNTNTQNRVLLHLLMIISTFIQSSHQLRFGRDLPGFGSTENVNRTVSGWPLSPLTAFCSYGETSISCGQTYPDSHLACHCDPRCVFYNDCCIDYALSCTSNGTLDYPVPETIVGINHEQVTCIRAPGSPSCGYYQFVSSCPSSWTRDDVRFECERDADLQSPYQFIPVDFMREITFKNVYCAICNGKDTQDLIPWVLVACCSGTISFDEEFTFERKVAFIIEQCEKWFTKAPELESSIERSCPVIPFPDRCLSILTDSSCFIRGDAPSFNSISLLLDFRDFRDFRSPVSCRVDQRFDSETLTCVNLTCPKGFILDEQQSCIRADPLHTTDKDCRGATNLPTNISIECIDWLSKLNDQCLPSFLLADELHSALDEIFNLTQELTVDRIQVMTPYYVDGNETKCTRGVNISGYLEAPKAQGQTNTYSKQLSDLWINVKMSTLLGFTWIFGFVAAFADVTALWYIFIILNSLQGVYIFIAFICNKRVFKLWRDSFSCSSCVTCGNVPQISSQSTTNSGPRKEASGATTSTFLNVAFVENE